MKRNTIKPGSTVVIQSGSYVQRGMTGYFARKTYDVVVRHVTKPLTFTPREIMESAYYRSVYADNGGNLLELAGLKISDPARYASKQIQLFPARVIWQGRSYSELQTAIDNVTLK